MLRKQKVKLEQEQRQGVCRYLAIDILLGVL